MLDCVCEYSDKEYYLISHYISGFTKAKMEETFHCPSILYDMCVHKAFLAERNDGPIFDASLRRVVNAMDNMYDKKGTFTVYRGSIEFEYLIDDRVLPWFYREK
jgi:hypothetical protein